MGIDQLGLSLKELFDPSFFPEGRRRQEGLWTQEDIVRRLEVGARTRLPVHRNLLGLWVRNFVKGRLQARRLPKGRLR